MRLFKLIIIIIGLVVISHFSYSLGDTIKYHIIQENENLFRLSLKYRVSIEDLKRWNNLNDNKVVLGNRYIVWKNEKSTLIKIAKTNDYVAVSDSVKKDTIVKDTTKTKSKYFILQTEDNHYKQLKTTFFMQLILNYNNSPILIKVLYCLIFYFFISALLLLIFISRRRIKENRKSKLESIYKVKFSDVIASFLFDDGFKLNKDSVLADLKSDFAKEIFMKEIFSLASNITGDYIDKLKLLYIDLNLKEYSIKKSFDKAWHLKAQGFRELAMFNVTDINNEIEKHINDKNPILATEAEIALIKLLPEKQLEFISNLEVRLSNWDQLCIYNSLSTLDFNHEIFLEWLKSKNISVVKFALKLIGVYKFYNGFDEVVKFLHHENEEVRNMAIITLSKLELEQTLEPLKNIFDNENYNNKITILEALSNIPEESNIEFLENKLMINDFKIRLAVAKTLVLQGEKGLSVANKYINSTDVELNKIVKHALDKRI